LNELSNSDGLHIAVNKNNILMDNISWGENDIIKYDHLDTKIPAINSGVQLLPYNIDNNLIHDNEENSILSKKYSILGLLWLIAMLSALDRVAMSVAIVPMTNEFGFTDTMKGSISSLFSVGYGLVIIPAGLAVASASPRIVLSIGIAIWSIATLATTQVTSAITISSGTALLTTTTLVPLLVTRAMVGAGESFVLPAIQRLLSAWTEPNEKASGTTKLEYIETCFQIVFICFTNFNYFPHNFFCICPNPIL
jgi:Major Facilitator Superfamily